MLCAGFAEATRRRIIQGVLAAGLATCGAAMAQAPAAAAWYAQGLQALAEQRYAEARAALLQAVQADPAFAGAWLDLAIATHADGDTVAAEEFLAILEARFTLPAAIADGVAALRQRMQAPPATGSTPWQWRSTVQAGGGYDTNANAGLALSDLTLTLPGGGVTLPLGDEVQPRNDFFVLASVATEGTRRLAGGQLEASARLKARRNASERAFDTMEAQAGLAWSSATPAFGGAWARLLPGPWRVGANLQQARMHGRTLLNSLALTAVHAWPKWPCAPQASAEFDYRRFPSASSLDARVAWAGAMVACPSPWIGRGGRLAAQLRVGFESANHAFAASDGRPGGDTRHQEATVSHDWSWVGRHGTHRLEALAQWSAARDTEGYSPLLADNARRHVRRVTYALAYSLPLAAAGADDEGWRGVLALQGFRQRSNLPIFKFGGEVLQFTLQRSW